MANVTIPNYPSNTSLQKEDKDDIRVVEKVISGNVTVRKRSSFGRLVENFLGEDLHTVKETFIYDMMIPGIKEGIIGVIEMMFFGSTSGRGRRSAGGSVKRNVDRASYMINYGSYSNGRSRAREERDLDQRYSGGIDEMMYDNRAEADMVLAALREDIAHYNEATLSAYYQYSGYSSNDYTAGDRGWTNLDMNIRPRRIRGGKYVLDLPRPQPLA